MTHSDVIIGHVVTSSVSYTKKHPMYQILDMKSHFIFVLKILLYNERDGIARSNVCVWKIIVIEY